MHRGVIFAGVATVAILAGGCTRPIRSPATLAAMKSEALALLESHKSNRTVSIARYDWPPAIASLNPQAVSVDQAGVDVLVKPALDGGYGYYVPRKGQPVPGPPKRYSGLGVGIYWYQPY